MSGIAGRHSRVTSSTMLRMPETPAAGELIVDKIRRHACVCDRLDEHRRPCPHSASPSQLFAQRETLLVIEPIDAVDPGCVAALTQKSTSTALLLATVALGMHFSCAWTKA